ncbi:MAG TPA: DUF4258 domain-containing protein [Terriglobales bacterium]|nr:DUF4258 domain-containing protein [Terriglobales bacterium]
MLKRLSRSDAVDLVHHCLEQGRVRWGGHFRKSLAEEKDVTLTDVWNVLRSGNIYEEPEQDIRTGDWKYRLEGHEAGGKWLAVVLTLRDENETFLITIFSIEAKRRKT